MPHTIEQVTVRPLRDEDFEPIAEIATANFPDDPDSPQELRDRYARFDAERFMREWIVAEQRGAVVAYGFWSHVPWSFHPDKYHAYVAVRPEVQRRGVGTVAMTYLLQRLRERGATRTKSWAREDHGHAVAFLHRFGFEEHGRAFESRLPVAAVDLAPFAGYVRRAEDAGAVITTLRDELRRDPGCLAAVYQSHCALDISAPAHDPDPPTPPRFARWVEDEVRSPRALLDAYFLAKMGDLFVGESALHRSDAEPGVLRQHLTAVLPEYRGLGIATALKVRTVEYAQIMGYREIRTMNSSRNAPMLAINAKLGFVRRPAWIDLLRAEGA